MEQEEFYKDQYDKSLERKNEINSSLSTPIGILSALVAGLLYAAANFTYVTTAVITYIFIGLGLLSIVMLAISIYQLALALTDANEGYEYAYLPDAKDLDAYFATLISFYTAQPNLAPDEVSKFAQEAFGKNIQTLLINGADNNQKRNKTKTAHRFACHRYMIYAFISLSLLIIPFGINFGINKGKNTVQSVSIKNTPLEVQIKTKTDTTYGKAGNRKTDTAATPAASNDSRRGRPRQTPPGPKRQKEIKNQPIKAR